MQTDRRTSQTEEGQTQSGLDDPSAIPSGGGSVRTAGLRFDVAFLVWRHFLLFTVRVVAFTLLALIVSIRRLATKHEGIHSTTSSKFYIWTIVLVLPSLTLWPQLQLEQQPLRLPLATARDIHG